MAPPPNGPLRIALVNDYELVVKGLDHFFDSYPDEVDVVELRVDEQVARQVDIALYDSFGRGEPDAAGLAELVANPRVGKVVVYTWVFSADSVERALQMGADGYLGKSLTASQLVNALQRVAAGERVVSPIPEERETFVGGEWPGRSEGLTAREAEIIAMIAQGLSNIEVAERAHLSINSVKSYIRNAYRKIGVTRRSQAVAWALTHGFVPKARPTSSANRSLSS